MQDAIKLRPNLELRVGFRFESTDGWNEVARARLQLRFRDGVIQTNPVVGNSVFTVNRAKFLPEPRVGLAWDPFGKGKTVVHAGFGIYRALLDNLDYRLDQTAPFNTTESLKNVPVTGLQIVPGTPLPAGNQDLSQRHAARCLHADRAHLDLQGRTADRPQTPRSAWDMWARTAITKCCRWTPTIRIPTICPASPCPATLAAGTIYYPTGAPLANPNLANTTTWFSEGLSSYNALQVDVNRRFSHGFQIRGVYTLSKSLDDGTALNSSVGANAPGFVMYPLNPKLDWGPSTSDVRNSP